MISTWRESGGEIGAGESPSAATAKAEEPREAVATHPPLAKTSYAAGIRYVARGQVAMPPEGRNSASRILAWRELSTCPLIDFRNESSLDISRLMISRARTLDHRES